MLEYTKKSFRDITNKVLSNTSLINLFNILKDEENNHLLNIFRNYKINEEIINDPQYFQYHDVEDSDFWENISYNYYRNKNLWWILGMVNDTVNPFEELTVGDTKKIISDTFKYDILKDLRDMSER